jgi:AcrR family transcriptional regulator
VDNSKKTLPRQRTSWTTARRKKEQTLTINDRAHTRRAPRQQRSRDTVGCVLDAVQRVLKRHGIDAVTTNRIAEEAGVSIGSVYQYFPDKRSVFVALHNRHVEEVGKVIQQTLAEHATSPLEELTRALVDGLLDVHAAEPELHRMISAEVPEGSEGFKNALHRAFERALSSRESGPHPELNRVLLVLPSMIEALVHGATERRPPLLSFDDARKEVVRTVIVYLSSFRSASQ